MCLYIKEGVKVAGKDITCYKIYMVHGDELVTIYRGVPLRKVLIPHKFYDKESYSISNGIHTFKNLKSAKRYAEFNLNRYAIVRCIIPKGCKYYEGKFESKTGFCSEKVIVVGLSNSNVNKDLINKYKWLRNVFIQRKTNKNS